MQQKIWDSQGSILGPLLFLIYINGLLSCFKTVTRFFADDTTLFFTGKTFKSMKILANLELARASKWMLANNLIVNSYKTIALTISLKTRDLTTSAFAVYYDAQVIHPSESNKYLGINLDD